MEYGNEKVAYEDQEDSASPYFAGPIVRYSGTMGAGKTFDMSRISMYAGFEHRLPIFAQDPKGDFALYHSRILSTVSGRKDIRSRKLADYLRNKVRISNRKDGVEMLDVINYIHDKMSGKEIRYPTLQLVVDEGGTLSFDNGENFWMIASTFRNDGILCDVTTHREKGIGGVPAIAREATRAVIVYPQYEDPEFFGVKIPPENVTRPMSNKKWYIDSVDRIPKSFEMPDAEDPIKDGMIPDVLTHPVNVTRIKKMRI